MPQDTLISLRTSMADSSSAHHVTFVEVQAELSHHPGTLASLSLSGPVRASPFASRSCSHALNMVALALTCYIMFTHTSAPDLLLSSHDSAAGLHVEPGDEIS